MGWLSYPYIGGANTTVPIVSLTLAARDHSTLSLAETKPSLDFIGTPDLTAIDEDAELNVEC